MDADTTPIRVLEPHECWELLRTAPFARLGLCIAGIPDIFPINFAVDGGTVVYRTSEGTKSHASEKTQVALEADGLLDDGALVWSVVVKGRAATISRTPELMATVHLPLHPWQAGPKDRFMRIVPESITGRAFPPAPAAAQDHSAVHARDE